MTLDCDCDCDVRIDRLNPMNHACSRSQAAACHPTGASSAQPPIFDEDRHRRTRPDRRVDRAAARELWPTALVIGVDNKDVLETAMRLHAIDVAADDLIVLAEADLVILAAPVKQNIALLGGARRERAPAGGRHRHRQHEARDRRRGARRCRRASRSSAAIRWPARRRAASSTRGRICSRPPVAADAAGTV